MRVIKKYINVLSRELECCTTRCDKGTVSEQGKSKIKKVEKLLNKRQDIVKTSTGAKRHRVERRTVSTIVTKTAAAYMI